MNYKLVRHGGDFYSIVENIQKVFKEVRNEDGDEIVIPVRRKKTPYHVKFMMRDGEITVIRGNLMLSKAEIKTIVGKF